jgi:hypothetical protein
VIKLAARPSDIGILHGAYDFEEHKYRTPYQFAGRAWIRWHLLNVKARVARLGYSGVVLRACKGQTHTVRTAAAAQK